MDGLTLLKRDHDSLRILFSLFRGTGALVFCATPRQCVKLRVAPLGQI